MEIFEELEIDVIGAVSIPQKDWETTALRMIADRRRQVTAAQSRATTERHQDALVGELKRLSDLEFYVRSCQDSGV